MNISIVLSVQLASEVPAMTINRLNQETLDDLNDWATDNWSNSAYWIIPNLQQIANEMLIEHSVFPGREQLSRAVYVPIMSYDGPTGEVEIIQIQPKYSN